MSDDVKKNDNDLADNSSGSESSTEQIEAVMLDKAKEQNESKVMPVRLNSDDDFNFKCHKGVSCWNKCCYGADITLTPLDVLRISKIKDMPARELLAEYTVPAIWEQSGLPVAKVKMAGKDGKGACPFLAEPEGCTIYENRPQTCRYYPLGLGSMQIRDKGEKNNFHFLVKEPHCKGHEEDKSLNVSQFKEEQGVNEYEEINRGWFDIIMKMASWKSLGGPQGKDLNKQTKQMFFMVSTDIAAFREFVFNTKFLSIYDIDEETKEVIKKDDIVLQLLGFAWLKNILFNEPTINMNETILREAIAKARKDMGGT